MKSTQNTILITGGSAGIGLAIAKLFSQKGHQVIITGRNKERLDRAIAGLHNITAIVSDVSKQEDVEQLAAKMYSDFPSLNIVINNAGHALLYDIADPEAGAFSKAEEEMLTNYLSVVRLNEKLLPLLKQQPSATIINVSSIVAFVPGNLAGYSASKAALHSYTNSLRSALEDSSVKVFELMPPLVNTEFSKPIGGENGISPDQVAEELFLAMESNNYEIHVGQTAELYKLFHASPADALKMMQNRGSRAVLNN
jgi:uncharacterized oxidoreductase